MLCIWPMLIIHKVESHPFKKSKSIYISYLIKWIEIKLIGKNRNCNSSSPFFICTFAHSSFKTKHICINWNWHIIENKRHGPKPSNHIKKQTKTHHLYITCTTYEALRSLHNSFYQSLPNYFFNLEPTTPNKNNIQQHIY